MQYCAGFSRNYFDSSILHFIRQSVFINIVFA